MFRIDTPSAVGALPAPATAGTPGYFGRGNLATGSPPTTLSADWANMVQEELMAVVTSAGLTPSKTNNAQLLAAIGVILQPYALIATSGKISAAGDLNPAAGIITNGFNVSSVTWSSSRITVAYTNSIAKPAPVVMGGDSANGSSSHSAFWGSGSSNTTTGFSANFGVSGGGGSITRATFVTAGI